MKIKSDYSSTRSSYFSTKNVLGGPKNCQIKSMTIEAVLWSTQIALKLMDKKKSQFHGQNFCLFRPMHAQYMLVTGIMHFGQIPIR